jgi:glycosyltransferase involved in cell wall biosynthesis
VKIVMTLLVRDVDDIIASNLAFHMEVGVDHVIVMDNMSSDHTRDILADYEKRGILTYIYQPEDTFSQARWVTEMARLACDKGADWVINSDADEFWYPCNLSLKRALAEIPSEYEAVLVERLHFVPRQLKTENFFADALTIRYATVLNSSGAPWPGKVCHRANPNIEVGYGNHSASVAGRALPMTKGPIEILHFPMRSYEKFEQNILNGGRANERNPERPVKRWEQLYALWKQGGLRKYFNDQVPDSDLIDIGLRDGRFVIDERLKRMFA